MKRAALLMPVDPVVSGIEIKDQLARRLRKGSDECFHQHSRERHRCRTIRAVFQSTRGGARSKLFAPVGGALPGQIAALRVAVVEIFIAQRQAIDALSQQIDLSVRNQLPSARIVDRLIQRLGQTEMPIDLAQTDYPTVTGNIAPEKLHLIVRRSKIGTSKSFGVAKSFLVVYLSNANQADSPQNFATFLLPR